MKSWDNPKLAYLVEMAIEKENHGQGYGSILLSNSLLLLSENGTSSVVLHVDPSNLSALHIYYDKFDFEFIEYRENEYGQGHDRVFMKLDIKKWIEKKCRCTETPWRVTNIDNERIEITKIITKKLRNDYYKKTPSINKIYVSPLYGKVNCDNMITESLGPFPEFILPTFPCSHTIKGYCTPCFFSKLPRINCGKEEILQSLITQTQFIVDNFNDVVINYQKRTDNYSHWDATICFACNGSFFSNTETSAQTRFQSISLLTKFIEEKKINMLTYIETCADDFIRVYHDGEIDKLYPFLQKLNVTLLSGFESVNDYTRNVIYAKNLQLSEFEEFISRNNELDLGTGAFIYLGFHSMTQEEIIRDVEKTLFYLRKHKVMPVLMFPNLQKYTIPHLLYKYNKYNLIDPRTAAYLINKLIDIFNNVSTNKHDPWIMGDPYGGPPSPTINVFSNKKQVSCSNCSKIISRAY